MNEKAARPANGALPAAPAGKALGGSRLQTVIQNNSFVGQLFRNLSAQYAAGFASCAPTAAPGKDTAKRGFRQGAAGPRK